MRLHRPLTAALVLGGIIAAAGPPPAIAQPRGHGGHGGGGPVGHPRSVVYAGGYYGPYAYWGYNPWYWYPYGFFYPPYAYYPGAYYDTCSVRIEVQPKDTEVFVDGYYAGVVDEFDGFFQRLHLRPGAHDITLYKDGYRRVTQRLYLAAGNSYRIRHDMVALAPGEIGEPRPEAPAAPPPEAAPEPPLTPQAPRPLPAPAAVPESTGFGQVALRVQPEGAAIFIDGEQWQGPSGLDRLVVHLPVGTHRIEVRKEGFDPFAAQVEVKPGETTALNVSLGGAR